MLQLRHLFGLYYRPLAATGEIVDGGSWLFGALLVVALSVVLQFSQAAPPQAAPHQPPQEEGQRSWAAAASEITSYGVVRSVAGLAICVVPAGILLAVLMEPVGNYGVTFQKDYASFLACALMGWSAAHLPVALLAVTGIAPPLIIWASGQALFTAMLACTFRTLYGSAWAKAALMAALAVAAMPAGLILYLYSGLGRLAGFLASPFILFWLWVMFRGDLGDLGHGLRTRKNFKRMMEAAALNPHDPDPHYQLGLIHQQRRQYSEAIARFEKAIAIDKMEADAHYQLGRIAREQGRLDEAMRHLETAAGLDDKLSFSEVWREIGATHLAAGRIEAAEDALLKFVARREYDAEGLYWLGEALLKLRREAEAKDCFRRCVEAVQGLPGYRRGLMRKWKKLAEKRL